MEVRASRTKSKSGISPAVCVCEVYRDEIARGKPFSGGPSAPEIKHRFRPFEKKRVNEPWDNSRTRKRGCSRSGTLSTLESICDLFSIVT